jgi:hypothetical protein
MAVRFYVVPKIGTGTDVDRFRPKYVSAFPVKWAAVDYGMEATFLVGADVDATQHTSISSNADVITIPANLDSTIGANLTTVQNALDSLKIPSDWVTSGMTYRTVIALVIKLFKILQRLHGRWLTTIFESGITLSTTFSQLTQAQRDRLQDVATSFGIDTSGVTGTTTIRQALKLLAQQLQGCALMGEVFA